MRRRGNISKRCMAAIISAVMLMSTGAVAFPMGVYADTYYLENGSVTVEAKDDGSQYVTQADKNINSVEDADPIISTDDPNVNANTLAADGSTTNTITINAEAGQTANVTLEDVNIDVSATENAKAVDTTGAGDVTIKLDGTNQVKSGEKAAGIQKENTGTLTITDTPGTNDDCLNAIGGELGAGIGGGYREEGSNITITGDTIVTATGFEATGIGGGFDGEGSYITIEGNATVTATGGETAAAIGGGHGKGGTNITIKDSATVTATGGYLGAGIGGGGDGKGTYITIADNATVTATGGDNAAAIGGGNNYEGTNITIEGNATVTATGGDSAAGIGGGYNGSINVLGIGDNSIVIATGGNSAIDIDNSYVCGGTGIGDSFFTNNGGMHLVGLSGTAEVYVSPGKSADGYPESPAIGVAPHYETDANQNTVLVSGTEIPEATLFQIGFNGTLTRYEPGTTTAQIRNIVFPNSQPVTDPSGNNTSDTKTSVQSDDTNNTENNDTDSNYTDNASSYQGITPAMLTRLINGLMGTSKAGVITIDFGRNICLTPEIMKILAETGNSAKNCSFIYKNKKYNLYIPIIDKNTNAYKDAMEVLKKEDNNRGFAGFMRVYEIYRDLGVTLQEIK